MHPPAIDFTSLVDQYELHLHRSVRVRGVLAMEDKDGYLVATPEARNRTEPAFLIDVPDLKNELLNVVPPLGGGTYYYLHDAVVTGRIERSDGSSYRGVLKEVSTIEVNVSGELFTVRLARR
jgi:hypothetical protein